MNKKIKGLTLLEIMVVITIVSILASVAIPSMLNFIRDSDVETAAMDFMKDLNISKQRAINTSSSVYVYPIDESTSFSNGWTIFNNGDKTNTNISNLVSVESSVEGFGLRFAPDGKVSEALFNTPLLEQKFKFCHLSDSNIQGREITINFLGKTKLEYTKCL